jgi:ABC-type nitrate/sulfonate/bicarbonate transport system substrate-binding protein
MPVAIHETAWRPFASNCKAVSLILGLLLLSYPRPAQSAVPAAGAELNRLRISIPGLGSSSYPLTWRKKGLLRSEGYDVELIPMAGGLAVKTLIAGEVNLTAAGTVVAITQGAKLRLVMAFIRQLPYDLVAAPEIKRVEDLRGKKVAVADRGSVTFFVARSILQGHGLEPDRDVTILNKGRPDVRYQALMMGTVQAVVANFDGTAFWSLGNFIRSPRRESMVRVLPVLYR